MDLIKLAEQAFAVETPKFTEFKSGETITVLYKIKDGNN